MALPEKNRIKIILVVKSEIFQKLERKKPQNLRVHKGLHLNLVH